MIKLTYIFHKEKGKSNLGFQKSIVYPNESVLLLDEPSFREEVFGKLKRFCKRENWDFDTLQFERIVEPYDPTK